ncbi:GTPase Era [bacterium]|nr:GTPase Era [bacterium]
MTVGAEGKPVSPGAKRSGVVAIAGSPNVGKSTLMNHLLGQKISIVSPKAQTTRQQVFGILSGEGFQALFIDTPGVIQPRDRMQKMMIQTSFKAVSGADVVIFILDAAESRGLHLDPELEGRLRGLKVPCILALNKIDLIPRDRLLPLIAECDGTGLFAEIIPVSALTGDGTGRLLDLVVRRLPVGEFMYSEEQIATQPMRFFAAELIREAIFEQFRQELPYAAAVQVEEYQERPGNKAYIRAVIFVEREGQKAILIGRGGEQLKRLGREARTRIEELSGSSIYLDLWVKVKENWRKNDSFLKMVGYTPDKL